MTIGIKKRCQREAKYMLEHQCTIRQVAKHFGYSESNVYTDLNKRLLFVNPELHKQIAELLAQNKRERSIRGGLATQKFYQAQKQNPS